MSIYLERDASAAILITLKNGWPSELASITERARQNSRDGRNKRDQQKTQEKDAQVFEDRPHRLLQPNAANQAGAVQPES